MHKVIAARVLTVIIEVEVICEVALGSVSDEDGLLLKEVRQRHHLRQNVLVLHDCTHCSLFIETNICMLDRICHTTYMSHVYDIFGQINRTMSSCDIYFVQSGNKCLTVYIPHFIQ